MEQAVTRVTDAEDAVMDSPVSTLVDLERKLTVLVRIDSSGSHTDPDDIETILADVRALMGKDTA